MEIALGELGLHSPSPAALLARLPLLHTQQLPALSCWEEKWCKPIPTAKVWGPRGAAPTETPAHAPLHPPVPSLHISTVESGFAGFRDSVWVCCALGA